MTVIGDIQNLRTGISKAEKNDYKPNHGAKVTNGILVHSSHFVPNTPLNWLKSVGGSCNSRVSRFVLT